MVWASIPASSANLRRDSGGPGDPGIALLAGQLEDQGRGPRPVDHLLLEAIHLEPGLLRLGDLVRRPRLDEGGAGRAWGGRGFALGWRTIAGVGGGA